MEAEDTVRQAYQVYYRRLVTQVFGLVGDRAEAEDAVQAAFARVLASPRSFLKADDAPPIREAVVLHYLSPICRSARWPPRSGFPRARSRRGCPAAARRWPDS